MMANLQNKTMQDSGEEKNQCFFACENSLWIACFPARSSSIYDAKRALPFSCTVMYEHSSPTLKVEFPSGDSQAAKGLAVTAAPES